MQVPSNFDPETVTLMGRICDEAWRELRLTTVFPTTEAHDQFLHGLVVRVMKAVAEGERDPVRLRAIAIGSPPDPKNRNEDKPWSQMDIFDLENSIAQGRSVAEVADFLLRRADEVRSKMVELGLSENGKTTPIGRR